jgi:putative redox protein
MVSGRNYGLEILFFPNQGGRMYKVNVANAGTTEFKVRSDKYEFTIDSEGETGITPPDTLLAAIGSCMGVYIRKYSKNTSLDIKGFEISLSAELSAEKPISFRKINAIIDLKGLKLDEMRQNSLIAFIKNCPVHNTCKVNPEIEAKII